MTEPLGEINFLFVMRLPFGGWLSLKSSQDGVDWRIQGREFRLQQNLPLGLLKLTSGFLQNFEFLLQELPNSTLKYTFWIIFLFARLLSASHRCTRKRQSGPDRLFPKSQSHRELPARFLYKNWLSSAERKGRPSIERGSKNFYWISLLGLPTINDGYLACHSSICSSLC